jgi:hypothetical protein
MHFGKLLWCCGERVQPDLAVHHDNKRLFCCHELKTLVFQGFRQLQGPARKLELPLNYCNPGVPIIARRGGHEPASAWYSDVSIPETTKAGILAMVRAAGETAE